MSAGLIQMSSRIVFKSVDGTRTVMEFMRSAKETATSFEQAWNNNCHWYTSDNADGSMECVNLDLVTKVRITEVPDGRA